MNKRYFIWENPKQAIFTIMVLLMVIGCINVFSASYVSAQDMFGDGFYYLKRYIIFGVLGFAFINIVRAIGYKRLLNRKLVWAMYTLVAAMLLLVDFIGEANKGAARWLYLGPVSIQPSEFAKPVVIMLAARYLGVLMKQGISPGLLQKDCRSIVMATVFYSALVLKQPDLGTAAIILALLMGMMIISGVSMLQVWTIIAGGAVCAVAATVTSPYRLDRIKVWLDPWLDEAGNGYQMVQSLLAIGSGGMTGTQWGLGSGKFFYLPESHTDFAFAIFCQENGFIGALVLLVLFCLLAGAFFRIASGAKEERGFMLASGITFLIIGQAAANMAMVCGLLPVIGVPLIFISYGGSSMLVSMVAIGMLISVYDAEERRELEEAVPPEERRSGLQLVGSRRWRR